MSFVKQIKALSEKQCTPIVDPNAVTHERLTQFIEDITKGLSPDKIAEIVPYGENHYNLLNNKGQSLGIVPMKGFDEAMKNALKGKK